MTLEQFDDILHDGTPEAIQELSGAVCGMASYSYSMEYGEFTVRFGSDIIRHHGTPTAPNCVAVFGPSHSF